MSGVREEAFYFGEGHDRLFGVLHRPVGRARRSAGWLVCPPFGSERTYSHRMMFEFSRALAREGFDVLRFDYRGSGDSARRPHEVAFSAHVEDAAAAAEELEARRGVPCEGMVGLRLGATVAAEAARNARRSPRLVLWQPLTDGARYCGELLRTAMVNELVDSGRAPRTREEMTQALSGGEAVPVDGHPLTRAMYESLALVDLAASPRPTASPVLIVQIDTAPGRPPARRLKLLQEAYARGGRTDLRVVVAPPAWLRVKDYDWRPAELFGATLDWIRTSCGPAARPRLRKVAWSKAEPGPSETRPGHRSSSPRTASRHPLSSADAGERPVSFSVLGKELRGILHTPRELARGGPGVVMLAAGESCRSSVFYVDLARTVARAGWPVLRFDPRGIGDSDGDFGCGTLAEVFRKIQEGHLVPDAMAAVGFLERELGVGTSVLTGLCGGAITAVYAAARDPRVVGIAPLELRLRCTPLPRFRHKRTTSQYLSWTQIAASRRSMALLKVRQIVHRVRRGVRAARAALARVAAVVRGEHAPGSDAWFVARLGADANLGMLRALGQCLERGLPILCVFGDTEEPELFDRIRPGLVDGRADGRSCLERRVIASADHNFVSAGSTDLLIETLLGWLASPERSWSAPEWPQEGNTAA